MINLNFPNPVREEKDFYGRREERKRIMNTLLGNSGRPVIILGERRIGKTSLLAVTTQRLANERPWVVPLFLPPAKAIHSLNDYAKEILQSLCSYLGEDPRSTELMDETGRIQLTSMGQFTDAVSHLLKDVNHTFVICADEFDVMLFGCTEAQAKKIRGLTDHIVQSDLPLRMYLTMTYPPDYTAESYESPVLTSESEIIELGPFSREETEAMIVGLLQNQVALTEPAMNTLIQLSGGHPYIIKLLLDRLLTHYWPGTLPHPLTQSMIEDLLPETTSDPRATNALSNLYKVHFSRAEQELLLILSDRETDITDEELKVLGPSFLRAAKSLCRRSYLDRSEDGHYRFRIEFLRWWLRDWEEYEEEQGRVAALKRRLEQEKALQASKTRIPAPLA